MAKKNPLTERQATILKYIINCVEQENRTPTMKQMAKKINLRAHGSVKPIIKGLVNKGELVKDTALSRGARLNPNKYIVKVSRRK